MTTKTLEQIKADAIKTNDATLHIQMPGDKLEVGSHTFRLQVEDNTGNVSQPVEVRLIVVDGQAPTAVLSVTDEQGQLLQNNQIGFGKSFILNGTDSVNLGDGNIVSYTWMLVE